MTLRDRVRVARIDFKYARKVPRAVERLSPAGEPPIKALVCYPLRAIDQCVSRRGY